MKQTDYRQLRGYAIISKGDTPQLVNEETFLVPSQTDTNKKYKVILRRTWMCECPDYQNRKTKCKHIYAVEFLLKMRDKLNLDSLDLEKELSKEIASESPNNIVTDGLWSYEKAIKKEFLPHRTNTEHIRLSTIREKPNNNLVERFHNTFREFDKVRRGFKTQQTAQLLSDGFRTYYNFIRPHYALDGLTPSQVAGVDLGLNGNKWLGLIKLANQTNGISEEKKFKLNFKSGKKFAYSLKVFDEKGNELDCKELGFKEKYFDVETADKFVNFYKSLYPKYEYKIEDYNG